MFRVKQKHIDNFNMYLCFKKATCLLFEDVSFAFAAMTNYKEYKSIKACRKNKDRTCKKNLILIEVI